MNNLHQKIEPILNLRTDRSHGWDERTRGQAPHKPFLLLSILDGIEQGWISENRIELSQELVETFFTYWNGIMGEERKTTISLPFYHMNSEPFWELGYGPGEKEYKHSPSLGGLRERSAYAVIEPGLFQLIREDPERDRIRQKLVVQYFSKIAAEQVMQIGAMNFRVWQYESELEEMVNKSFVPYQEEEGRRRERTITQQIRERAFSSSVRKNYNYSCAVCRNKIITPDGRMLVIGAHIIPWNESYNDDLRNGISLCRNHHWMFDRFAFTIRHDFTIRVSSWLERHENRYAEAGELKSRTILLPENSRYYPSAIALEDHNDRFESHYKNL